MEHLTLNDEVAAMGGGPQTQSQQLPPQMFTTAAQLLDLTDSKYGIGDREGIGEEER
jgi:hypothetical protein